MLSSFHLATATSSCWVGILSGAACFRPSETRRCSRSRASRRSHACYALARHVVFRSPRLCGVVVGEIVDEVGDGGETPLQKSQGGPAEFPDHPFFSLRIPLTTSMRSNQLGIFNLTPILILNLLEALRPRRCAPRPPTGLPSYSF